MTELLECQITEEEIGEEIEDERSEGSVPLAVSVMGDFEEDSFTFYPWKNIAGEGIPMPPIGYVVQSTGSSRRYVHRSGRRMDFEVVHYKTGERCLLRNIPISGMIRAGLERENSGPNYAWINEDEDIVSF